VPKLEKPQLTFIFSYLCGVGRNAGYAASDENLNLIQNLVCFASDLKFYLVQKRIDGNLPQI
jgi:hypothetical protein